jgi:benzodiazapine receptor
MRRGWPSLAIWLLVCLAAGLVGARFLPGAWYESLAKPSWTPPDSVFGPVWTVLYIMMGIAAWTVWRRRTRGGATPALFLFAVQLILNSLWTYIFFGLQRPGAAFLEILALWIVLMAALVGFWRVRTVAGLLMLPYLLWVSFASALNFQIWRLNV